MAPGEHHTAGLPTGTVFTSYTVDQHTFKMKPIITWPGPGHHVHLVAYDGAGKLIVDPFFEFELAPVR